MRFTTLNVLAALLYAAISLADPLPSPVFWRSGLDGNANGTLAGKILKPTEKQALRFEPSDQSKALTVGAGTSVRYDLGNTFPSQTGALEIRFRPNFPQTANTPAREVLRLKGKGDSNVVLSFSPKGVRWILTIKGRKWWKEMILWHGRVQEGKWNHVLFVWNKPEKSFAIYHRGEWVETRGHDNRFGGPAFLEIGGEHDAGISLDEVAIHNRAFTHAQAKFLADSFQSNGDRLNALIERLKTDDKALADRRALLAKIDGKVGLVYHRRGIKPSKGKLSEDVTYMGIPPEDIGKIDLSQFSVIHFPKGPKFQIVPDQFKHIVDYVKNGGGYVGCCQGAYFAEKLKLLDIKCYGMDVWGLYNIVLKDDPHFVMGGRKGIIRMHFGNGPVMVSGGECQVLGTYMLGFPAGEPAAILTGRRGKGNVVLFGTHPTGDKVSYKGSRAWFSGKLMGTEKMFINALLYAAGIVDGKGVSKETGAGK